jgi:putative addiction module component (TIGR02574 family)
MKKEVIMAISMKEINKLSVAEKIVLAEKIWDSIPDDSDEFTISNSDKRELDKRLDRLEAGTAKTVNWQQLKRKLRMRRK